MNFTATVKTAAKLRLYFSPTLNFHASENGLQFAVSIDDEQPQIISLNKEDNTGVWNQWMTNNIIIKTTVHKIANTGKTYNKILDGKPWCSFTKTSTGFWRCKTKLFGPPETIKIKNKLMIQRLFIPVIFAISLLLASCSSSKKNAAITGNAFTEKCIQK